MPENTAKMSSPSPTSINKALDLGTALKRKASLSSITTRRNGVVQSSKPLKVIVLGQASVGKTGEFIDGYNYTNATYMRVAYDRCVS